MIQRPCIDRILPSDIFRFQRLDLVGGRIHAVAPIGKAWVNGSVLRVRFMGGTPKQHAIVREQAGWWERAANLKFDFNNAPDAEIRISFDPAGGAWSYIGTDCRHIPFEGPTMNLGFLDGGTPAHEFGHAIGLGHEHANPSGGIAWNEEVVKRSLSGPPNFWTPEMIRHNVFYKYSADQINGTAFDPDSIMLYWFPGKWTLNGLETKANEVLSGVDKMFIGGAKMYPPNPPTTIELGIELFPSTVYTSAEIGAFGEEDLFWFKADPTGRYIISTEGKTDVVMKLFGPGSKTALIAEDDDSGSGLNARINKSLIAGRYYVSIRHWNRQKGVGLYYIKVRNG